MKAILVEYSLMTRIIVPDDFNIKNMSDEDDKLLKQKVTPKFHNKLNTEGVSDLLHSIVEDQDVPFGTAPDDEYFQPSFDDLSAVHNLHPYEVFEDKEIAQNAFPGVKILTYHDDDIKDKRFVDKFFV